MKRDLIPGSWSRTGLAVPTSICERCAGAQGRGCLCRHPDLTRVTLTELDLEIPPDAYRFAMPKARRDVMKRSPRDRARDIFWAVAALAVLAAVGWAFPR